MNTNPTDAEILKACKGAQSVLEVLTRLGKTNNHRKSITKRLESLGVLEDVKKMVFNKDAYTQEQLKELASETCNVSEIARRLNLDRGYHKRIRKDLEKMGLEPNGRNKVGYKTDDIIRCAKEVTSMFQLCEALGLKKAGGNCDLLRKKIAKFDIDTSHWEGQLWSKGKQLKKISEYSKGSRLKIHLIKQRGHRCEECHGKKWKDKDIPLELEHIDGNSHNNKETNLKLLCCNCHSQTRTYRNAKR